MLIVSYKINDLLVDNYNNNETGLNAALIVIVTVILSGLWITWMVFQFIWFGSKTLNVVIMVITLICIIAFYGLVFIRTRSDASLLTSSYVALYCTYLQWAGLSSLTYVDLSSDNYYYVNG